MVATQQKRISSSRKFGRVVRNVFGILLGAAFIAVLASLLPIQGMYKLYTVQSGSMEPKIRTGSLVAVMPSDTYAVGDIITFTDSANSKSTTTHRIISIDETSYLTKGDANDSADVSPVQKTNVVGKVLFHLPYLGYPVGYAKTLPGLIILIVIPSTIIIWEELKKLKKEWHQSKNEGEKQALAKSSSTKKAKIIVTQKRRAANKNSKNISTGLTAFILMATMSVATLSIKAFFNDKEPAVGSLTSGAWETKCLLINEVYYDVDAAYGLDGEDINGKKENGNQNNAPDEWIEIYNNCDRDISLKNWTITDNEDALTIHANKSVPALGYGLISKTASTWTRYWGFSGLGNLTGIQMIETGEDGQSIYQVLDNAGDMVQLKDADGRIIDQMNYGNDTSVWDPAVPCIAEGRSLSRNPVGHDTDEPVDFVENILPSPGQPTVTVEAGN